PNYHVYLKLMVDGITSRPFSAVTLPPFPVEGGVDVSEKIIESSRRLYTRPREIVEKEITDWSGMMIGIGPDGNPTTPTPGEGKFKAQCSICGKDTIVPFEPAPGRPVYCKDCITKIKAGELQPIRSAPRSRAGEARMYAPLASLGIE